MAERFPRLVRRLVAIGASASDPEALRVRKAVVVLSTALMAGLACVWVVTYALLGLWLPAAIPFAYQVASALGLAAFARTHGYVRFRDSQLALTLLLPFALQWSLGGFEASSAVGLWGFTSPLGALLIVGSRAALGWFAAFVALVVVSAAIDPALADHAAAIPDWLGLAFFALNIVG